MQRIKSTVNTGRIIMSRASIKTKMNRHRRRMKPFVPPILKRTMASQMSDAELERTIAKIQVSTNKEELAASGEVLKFDGFLKVYREDRDEDEQEESAEGMLPPMAVGQSL